MNYIVLYHIGLGDHIVMNGFIHYLLKQSNTKNICILSFNNYSKNTLEHLYSDYSQISFHYLNDIYDPTFSMINNKPYMSTCIFNHTEYHILTFGLHSENRSIYINNYSWATSFYIHAGINPKIQYIHFTLPTDMSRSKDKYTKLLNILKVKEYILIHDDPSRGRFLHENTVKDILEKNGHIGLPIVYLGLHRYNYPLISNLNNILNIENILTGLNINFTKQKTFEDCKFKNKLKFDFYIPEKNICIEFDGEQHFKPIRYFGGNKSFELQKIKDQIKNEYCNKNKIKLIRFRFDEDPIKIEFEINKLIIL